MSPLLLLLIIPRLINAEQCDVSSHFDCESGHKHHCIPLSWLCDNSPDCPNGKDENDCRRLDVCLKDQLACRNGECAPVGSKCDGHSDCSDGSDERDCPPIERAENPMMPVLCNETEQFECGGRCVDRARICDGFHMDCPNDEDEAKCHHHRNHKPMVNGADGEIRVRCQISVIILVCFLFGSIAVF